MFASKLLTRRRRRRNRANRRIGAADSFRLGEMELSTNLPSFPQYQQRFLKAYNALVLSQAFEIERFDENHRHCSATPI
jgi:hypothetical protein